MTREGGESKSILSYLYTFLTKTFKLHVESLRHVPNAGIGLDIEMDRRPRLPYDVLLLIASYASRDTLLSFMFVSYDFHNDCARHLLGNGVKLRGNRDIVSFISFMRPGKRKRWRYLRSLSFDNSTINPAIAAELARVLARASHLERLVFGWAERTLGAHPDLPPAFAAIKSIKHLVLVGGYQYTCRMLEAMHWPLETAKLTRSEYKWDWHDPDRLDRMHPASLLRNACSTLKSLELDEWRDCSDILPRYPVFPDLRSLLMKETWCPSTAQWVVTYPNLQSLTVRTINGHLMAVAGDDLLEHALHRRLNLETHSTQTCWPQLESFTGTLLDLYLLGLPCRISSVSVDLCADSLRFFTPVMDHARPIHLNLRLNSLDIDIPVIGKCLQHAGLVDLRRLTLSITFYSLENEVRGDHINRFLVGISPHDACG